MRLFKLSSLAIAAILAMGFTGNALAFHDGGVANCDGCHTMHNSYKGLTMSDPSAGAVLVGNAYLLQGSDPSSTCLICHNGTGNAPAVNTTAAGVPTHRTPGGDFAWLKTSLVDGTVTAATESTNRHGHHIIAADFGFTSPNTDNSSQAPGGTYPSTNLGCPSCHNPHNNLATDGTTGLISGSGSYGGSPATGTVLGAYRLLAGAGYSYPLAPDNAFPSTANPPVAVAPTTYDKEDLTLATQTRVAYGSGMSEWCGNCHGLILNNAADITSKHTHVAGANAKLDTQIVGDSATIASYYQGYVNSGETTGGAATAAYLALVPYEMGTDTSTSDLLAAVGSQDASSALGGNVMCLSCHRAHATGFDSMTRFDMQSQFTTDSDGTSYAYLASDGNSHADTTAYLTAAYNGLPASTFGPSQRTLCNKCHAKG